MNDQFTKEQIRAWLMQRQMHPKPLPDLAQIQQQLRQMSDERPTLVEHMSHAIAA